MRRRRERRAQQVEELLRRVGVDVLGEQSLGPAARRADGREQVQALEPALLGGPRPRTPIRPDGRQRALLAEAGFVFEPDFERLAGVIGRDLAEDFREFFSNSAAAAGSASGCWGRGWSTEKPSLCRRL